MKKIKAMLVAVVMIAGSLLTAADGLVTISCDYPGGNVKVVKIQPGCAEIEPDLRDTIYDWFYWNFDAVATEPGTVHFCFPENKWKISAQGPAVSTDGGKTWKWLGKGKTKFVDRKNGVTRDSFEWTFTKAGEKVRFAQGIPYQYADFEAFYKKHQSSPLMRRTVLTKTRKGVDVPMLIVGSGPLNIMITARHHSCEAIASYALEGFLTEALSDSPAGREFRKKYTLYAIPFVDLDGVEAGDQGKNRGPHDHNRDYALGEATLYPEIKAIQELDRQQKFFVTLDLHAPSVRNDVHEAIYFAGFQTPTNRANTVEFKSWLDAERPADTNAILILGGSKVSPPDGKNGAPNSLYFATNPTTVYGTTIEIAYAGSNYFYNEKAVFLYGKALLKALVKTEFRKDTVPRTGYKDFAAFCKSLRLGRPDHTLKACTEALAKADLPGHYRAAALLQRAYAYSRLKGNHKQALADNEAVLASPDALQSQKYTAAVQKTALLCSAPDIAPEVVDSWAKELQEKKLVAGSYLFDAYESLYVYYNKRGLDHKAIAFARMQLYYTPYYAVGKVRNRIMMYELKYGDKEKALAYGRETVAYLKTKLYPKVPVGVFAPMMVIDYVQVLSMLPETTVEEVEKVAELAFTHKLCRDHQRVLLEQMIKDFKAKKGSK